MNNSRKNQLRVIIKMCFKTLTRLSIILISIIILTFTAIIAY